MSRATHKPQALTSVDITVKDVVKKLCSEASYDATAKNRLRYIKPTAAT